LRGVIVGNFSGEHLQRLPRLPPREAEARRFRRAPQEPRGEYIVHGAVGVLG